MQKKYNIGLDIGTTSVGWAVVESNNQKILRKGKKRLWGVRLFEEAVPAVERRKARSIRRRYERRRQRIKLLQEEFKNEINKVDINFYTKLKESFYNEKDNENKTIKLTGLEKQQIKDYYEKYPTIYHLRNKLVHSQEQEDIRLVYLAIHHIIKYRGNFLSNSDSFNVSDLNINDKLVNTFENILNVFTNLINDDYYNNINFDELSKAIMNPSKNDRAEEIKKNLINVFPKVFINQFIKMINGTSFDFNKMFNLDDLQEKIELCFDGTDYEENYDDFEKILDDKIEILSELKELYDMIFLGKLFGGSNKTNISDLMVEKYNVHRQDLKFLKSIFEDYREAYNEIFRTKKSACLYEQYVTNKISSDDFSKKVMGHIEKIYNDNINNTWTKTIERIKNGVFLPRITDKVNSKYPYQVNKDELIKIIERQGKYYPFLLNKIDDEKGEKYKILKLLEFRIPYYVGPLTSKENSKFAWMVRKKDNIKITPYNFDEIVNREDSAEEFIKRMISNCTYLSNEKAIPSNSILYSKYKVLNELKQISINNYRLSKDVQHNIYNELFLNKAGTITDKVFKQYLKTSKDFDMYEGNILVTGYSADEKFANNMQSYIDFFGIDGIFSSTNYTEDNAEEIIEWCTIFEDKEVLRKKVEDVYKELSTTQIDKILSRKYKGWSRLSKKLLTQKHYFNKSTETNMSIMDLMYETEENFMQIINDDKYNFQKMVAEHNKISPNQKISYKLVEDLATSPSTKRGIYQALRVVEEIVNYMGDEPQYISIEMARSSEEKKRTDARKKYLEKLYEKAKEEISNYNKLMRELKGFDDYNVNPQKLFLYFIQEGKCLYSGESLCIDNLDKCEIDHILPRTLIKDDSLDNTALVLKEHNQIKGSSFVLPPQYRSNSNYIWWERLKKLGLISGKKFFRLTRKEYKDKDIEGFINRQLVETRQITKHVANILNTYYKNSKIIYLKSNVSHNYRQRYELFKFRQINDYHHAHDAYLTAVLGEYKEKFMPKKVDYDLIKEMNSYIFENKMYEKLKYGFIINSLDDELSKFLNQNSNNVDLETGEVLFSADKFNRVVKNNLYCNDILISKKTEIRTGEFYNQTKNKKGLNGVKLKDNMPTKLYGSYTGVKPSYAIMVEFTSKNQIKRRMVGLPIYVIAKSKGNGSGKLIYLKELLKLKESDTLRVISKPIPFYSLLNWDNQICYLVGATNSVEVCNAKQFKVDKNFMINHKYALNKLLNYRKMEMDEHEYNNNLGEIIKYIVGKMEKEYILFSNLIEELKAIVSYDDLSILLLEEKENVIIQLFELLNCKSGNANFKFLSTKYSSAFGKKHSRIIESAILYNKSVTAIKVAQTEL